MTQQLIGISVIAGDGLGDPGRTAFGKVNANDTELYALVLAASQKLFVQNASPGITTAHLWVQTGLGGGADATFWIEDGLP